MAAKAGLDGSITRTTGRSRSGSAAANRRNASASSGCHAYAGAGHTGSANRSQGGGEDNHQVAAVVASDREDLVDDPTQRTEARIDSLRSTDRQIAMQDFLQDLRQIAPLRNDRRTQRSEHQV